MKVAITGATGFIGRKLVRRCLDEGYAVHALSRRAPETSGLPAAVVCHRGDLSVADNLETFISKADVLFHCAGEVRDETRMRAVHVDGTQRLIEAARGNIGRWVQLSSVGAYGRQRAGVVTEETPLAPLGAYEETKVAADRLVEHAADNGAFAYTILRPSNVYGGDMSNQSLFGLIGMIQRGGFFFIGKSGATANYIHVDNVVEALMLCAAAPQAAGRCYNLSDCRTMEEFIATLADRLGCRQPRLRLPETSVRLLAQIFGSLPGVPLTTARVDALTTRACYSSARIVRELGYCHQVTMENGLAELVDAWQRRQSALGR